MAPISAEFHHQGSHILHYLNNCRQSSKNHRLSLQHVLLSRDLYKLGKVLPDTRTEELLWDGDSLSSFEGFSNAGEDTRPARHNHFPPRLPVLPCKGLDETSRTRVVLHSPSSAVVEENVSSTYPTKSEVGQTISGRQLSCQLGYQQPERPGMVAGDPELGAGSTPPVGHPRPPLHRCLD
ncbi:hypothetical protein E2C01_049930 [Portunus trituberculatus]|uniref:Uncharacterized protein n=1 Tax=Portunus trituberculatus TaxID=210409 RepID=A0A5B7G7N5_PORTR|nr:hypothetical protein [Portunus trituberculatus]